MLLSALTRNGRQILLDCFRPVLDSPDKEVWKKALSFMESRINLMRRTLGDVCANHSEDATYLIGQIWEWEEARKMMAEMFGKKFILPALRERRANTPALHE